MSNRIYIGNDHSAVEMKQAIVNHLKEKNYEVIDLGNNDGKSCNYAKIGQVVAEHVVNDPNSRGIVICGTGIGISIAANKVKTARAALVYEKETAELARIHNDANILALGARIIAIAKAINLVDVFLNTPFEGGRHIERVNTLNEYKN
ncbi:ribose 5-phosphate isomerase B [Mycoplasma feriruminatoris]|uniref:Ribose 5-phosphate isomerase RpiB n=1 Tax=Mycoplasma feriruminatoris TaxID=1179777 RepID=A0AAQ3HWW6_9MOLU|nr:ribose 5-phosphate isomerase B [Mycoplasma feriruminatoris]UKS54424.1 ribose 5-phosphate isomerase B [Mycoplasma feriruminatoris]WFQ90479.1 Ribose-5-P isomerase B [Mycoplasma feriruminatoris]WFQ91302.1 ribose 5-phosphate isomerase RpiB [Mycoplasma feriruminatoris]WFQ92122.1 Ribose-5-P isomerase B [Mycoplasma feriruminatoris]WFQ92966.1 Ribose-5-P isomerase B [Mycoplasma feriruminatoris]